MDNVILVAGYNYHSLTPGPVAFLPLQIARHRCIEIFAGAPDNQAVRRGRGRIRVVLMDVQSGTVTSMEENALGERRERVIAQHVPVSPENYQWVDPGRWLFCRQGEGVLSILDVYDLVKEIGRREPGTLVELSFISHGWAGGPSLVNSDDRIDRARAGPASDDEPRDPLDKDGRRFKDFRPPTTRAEDLGLMRRAFSAQGYVWNWSCNNSRASADVVNQVVRSDPRVLADADDPDRTIEFRFSPEQQDLYFEIDASFFPPAQLTFRRSLGDVTMFLWRRMRATYNGQAALALDKPCYGPLPGMPSDIERGGTLPQMIVPHTPDHPADRSDALQFYERFLSVRFDSEGRRFGEYQPDALRAASLDAADLTLAAGSRG